MERPPLLREFRLFCRHVSVGAAFSFCAVPRILSRLGVPSRLFQKWQNRVYLRAIEPVLSEYDKPQGEFEPEKSPLLEGDYKIFTYWHQGWDNVPEIVRTCHESLVRNAGAHEIVCLDANNIGDYCRISDVIKTRLAKGEITLPHYKDYLSCEVLREHGGLWIDACVFVTRPIDLVDSHFFSIRYHNRTGAYCDFKYAIALMAMPRGCFLASALSDCLVAYWASYSMALHYIFFADIMDILYKRYSYVRWLLSSNDQYCDDFYDFRFIAGEPCNMEKLENILKRNGFLSLTYRNPIPESVSGKLTYWGELLRRLQK